MAAVKLQRLSRSCIQKFPTRYAINNTNMSSRNVPQHRTWISSSLSPESHNSTCILRGKKNKTRLKKVYAHDTYDAQITYENYKSRHTCSEHVIMLQHAKEKRHKKYRRMCTEDAIPVTCTFRRGGARPNNEAHKGSYAASTSKPKRAAKIEDCKSWKCH